MSDNRNLEQLMQEKSNTLIDPRRDSHVTMATLKLEKTSPIIIKRYCENLSTRISLKSSPVQKIHLKYNPFVERSIDKKQSYTCMGYKANKKTQANLPNHLTSAYTV